MSVAAMSVSPSTAASRTWPDEAGHCLAMLEHRCGRNCLSGVVQARPGGSGFVGTDTWLAPEVPLQQMANVV